MKMLYFEGITAGSLRIVYSSVPYPYWQGAVD